METALIGLLGVLLGIILNETLRRRHRIENYSSLVFKKRLEIHEELFQRVGHCHEIAADLIKNEAYSKTERHEIVSNAILPIAKYCDENELYINEELSAHCIALLMGVEDIFCIGDEKTKKKEIDEFWKNFNNAKKMIRKEAGIADLDKLFMSITKSKLSSPVIDYIRSLRKKKGIKGKWE